MDFRYFSNQGFWSILRISFVILNLNMKGIVGGGDYVLVVVSNNSSSYVHQYQECEARGAQFGHIISGDETIAAACAVAASPRIACDKISPPPVNYTFDCIGGYFAVAIRGNCTFAKKAFQAGEAGYNGMVIYNNEPESDPVDMATDGEYGPRVRIPAFMVRYDCGLNLVNKYSYDKGFAFYVRVHWSYHDFLRYLVPFAAVVGVCFVLVLSAMVVKLVRDQRRRNRRRLSKKHLKQIPIKTFASGDDADTCPICLEDFQVGDQLRILPCAHSYHCQCIDPWLLKNRRVCPICKRKVLARQNGSSNSDSDTEETTTAGPAGPSGVPSTPERTPLLVHEDRNYTVGNSTFYGVYAITGDTIMPNQSSSIGTSHSIERTWTDDESPVDDPTVEVCSRQSLIPQSSIQSSTDECAQPGFVTASSSLREGYANPNFIIDAHELECARRDSAPHGDSESGNAI